MKKKKCNCSKYEKEVCDICQRVGEYGPFTFERFSKTNRARCNKDIRPLKEWSSLEWSACIAGEVGELCNFLKKIKRGDKIPKKELAHELADIVAYVDLTAASLDIDLGEAVKEKFNIVSKRHKSKFRL
jgi:NTP pyrophosphatase (non-canonical NTP hydrolase)